MCWEILKIAITVRDLVAFCYLSLFFLSQSYHMHISASLGMVNKILSECYCVCAQIHNNFAIHLLNMFFNTKKKVCCIQLHHKMEFEVTRWSLSAYFTKEITAQPGFQDRLTFSRGLSPTWARLSLQLLGMTTKIPSEGYFAGTNTHSVPVRAPLFWCAVGLHGC